MQGFAELLADAGERRLGVQHVGVLRGQALAAQREDLLGEHSCAGQVPAQEEACLLVRDQGPGIAADLCAAVFERGVQRDSAFRATKSAAPAWDWRS